jgi:hypothetical protein
MLVGFLYVTRGLQAGSKVGVDPASYHKEGASAQDKAQGHPRVGRGALLQWGIFSEVLVYHDDEAIYLEHKGRDSGVVRFTFEMIEGLKIVEDEEEPTNSTEERADLTAKKAG